ncbi:MAG: hypothetical protein WDN08_07250 [Rhizomicrobium sp.]
MFFGIPVDSFVFVHTLITLVAIVAGLVMLWGMLRNERMDLVHTIFLLFSVLTAATGFILQVTPVTPAVATGVVLSVALVAALAARYGYRLAGSWRWIYVVGAVLSLYLNCFVLVVQSYLKVPALHALAPGLPPAGPVFGATQAAVLVAFIVAGYFAVRRFHPRP